MGFRGFILSRKNIFTIENRMFIKNLWNKNQVPSFILISIVLFTSNCASEKFSQREDYQIARDFLLNADPEKALVSLPQKERGSFIVALEKAYLSILAGKPELNELQKQRDASQKRLRFSAGREIKSLFYLETPEGYYASEHEIIWMHILLGWGYAMQSEADKSCIEAKSASALLSSEWSPEGRFDDPMLRILVASVWAMCGNWESTKVDLRVAYSLNKKLTWIPPLIAKEYSPATMYFILGGGGAEPIWDPKTNINLIRGIRNMRFDLPTQFVDMDLKDSKNQIVKLQKGPNAENWYERHFVRDNSIHEIVEDSSYFQNSIASTLVAAGKTTGGVALGLIIITGGIALGAAVVYLGYLAESGEVLVAGIMLAVVSVGYGFEVGSKQISESLDEWSEEMDTSEYYRYVRFLPEFLLVGVSDKNEEPPFFVINKKNQVLKSKVNGPLGRIPVYLIHTPSNR
jgi:hypothetical protein